jgi:plasmid stabilization system protein ParE
LPARIENRDDEIFPRIQVLADHPDMGRVVPGFDRALPREIIHPPFRIVYRRDPQRVIIVRTRRREWLLHLQAANDEAS